MNVLVLGGAGFVGRHAVAALLRRGHRVVVGSRRPATAGRRLPEPARACERREVHLDWLTAAAGWKPLLRDVHAVVNCVGILRERWFETYERVHYLGPRALAEACALQQVRLVHVSALGLERNARSMFLRSKYWGERALMKSAADWTLVRPSLLDGAGGFASAWLRRVARWPVHLVPADAKGRIAPLDVADLGEALAVLCERSGAEGLREVELGGSARRTMGEHLAALRRAEGLGRTIAIPVPGLLVRLASHLCDLAHFSPLSFGHWELMRRDNAPKVNLLPALLGRAPAPVGVAQAPAATPAGQFTPVPPSPQ